MARISKEDKEALYQEARRLRNSYRKTGFLSVQALAWWKATPERWAWLNLEGRADVTEAAIQNMNEIFDWMDTHGGKLPRSCSRTKQSADERVMGQRLMRHRQHKAQNKKGWPIYGSKLITLSRKRGYPGVFNPTDVTESAIQKMNEVFDWMDCHEGQIPYLRAKDPVEKRLGAFLSRQKAYKSLKIKGWLIYGPRITAIAKKRGYPRALETSK